MVDACRVRSLWKFRVAPVRSCDTGLRRTHVEVLLLRRLRAPFHLDILPAVFATGSLETAAARHQLKSHEKLNDEKS